MKRSCCFGLIASCFFVLFTSLAQAELLAMLNYESKPEQMTRKEGLAIIDVDPKSPSFGKMLMDHRTHFQQTLKRPPVEFAALWDWAEKHGIVQQAQ